MAATKTGATRLLGVSLGMALLGVWLAGWHLLFDAAGWFAPATALVGVALWLSAQTVPPVRLGAIPVMLNSVGIGAMILAVAASLSLGAFLPAGLAEWVSPVLGRFGGFAALLVLAVGMLLGMAVRVGRGSGPLPHLAVGLGFAALWVGSQVARQATFPPPPTTAELLSSRFDLLLLFGLLFATVPVAAWLLERPKPGRASTTDAKTPQVARWRMLFPFAIRWALLMTMLGLIGSLLLGSEGWYRFALLALVLVAVTLAVVA
nr:hypothetical protein [Chloroflexota bacterium]